MKMICIFAMIVLFTACASAAPQVSANQTGMYKTDTNLSYYADPDTGCEYILAKQSYGISITPRYQNMGGGIKGCTK